MSTDRQAELRALLAFYAEAGVDTVLDEAPVNRFTAETPDPRPAASPQVRTSAGGGELYQRKGNPERGGSSPSGPGQTGRPRFQAPPSAAPPGAPPPPEQAAMAAREAAAGAKSLEELRAMLERFEGCALRFTAKQLVFADGNPQARLMIVGEAPGREEDQEGRPFVGRSGQLLDRMLAAIGLDRTSVYIANLVPWRPPGNRTPTPQESQICLPFLKRQIELVDPDILLCLGGPSAAALLGMTDGIRKFRGRWRAYHTGAREIRALATFHPSYLLRTPIEKRHVWRDFLAVCAALKEGE